MDKPSSSTPSGSPAPANGSQGVTPAKKSSWTKYLPYILVGLAIAGGLAYLAAHHA
jgi:hypothetical protein